jgi:hypothetical protein
MQHNDIDLSKPLLLDAEAVVPRPASYIVRVRRALLPYKRVIHAANAAILLCYMIALAAAHVNQDEAARRSTRTLVVGR